MAVRFAGGSIQGRRAENQDTWVVTPHGAGVFDGVAGRPFGSEAARAAAAGLSAALADPAPLSRLDAAVGATGGAATAAVVRFGAPCMVWTAGDATVLHVDSDVRCVTPSDGFGRLVTQCLGVPNLQPHEAHVTLRGGDRLVLCSDGVTAVLDANEIAALVRDQTPNAAVEAILAAVEVRGAPDNATVIVGEGH